MLQQTQVATVEAYFQRFLAELPQIADLAAADEADVLRLWEGLGYYRRARQLHRAAKVIVDRHGGHFPSDSQAVRELPGIGAYTAGAILSIAFDAREPILEANTTRLFSRLLAYDGLTMRSASQKLLWQAAAEVLPRSDVGEFNQALMELGSQVCTPRRPKCEACPVAVLCRARIAGRVDEIPQTAARPQFEELREAAVVVYRRGKILVRRRPEGEWWAGLWDFPRFEVSSRRAAALRTELATKVQQATGVTVAPQEKLTTIRHGVTRFRITLECHVANYISGRTTSNVAEFKWLRPAALEALPLSSPGRKLGKIVIARET